MDPETARVYSDLIKVGIPSAVAIVSATFSFFIAKKGYRKDIEIENLRTAAEIEHRRSEREGELIKDSTSKLNVLHGAFVRYGIEYATYIETQNEGGRYSAVARAKLSDLYGSAVNSLHMGTEIQTNILLLGDGELVDMFRDYQANLSKFTTMYPPDAYARYPVVTNALVSANELQDKLYKRLSAIYLLKQAQNA